MKVRAIKQGYLKHFREIGDEFEIQPKQFSKLWMVEVSDDEPKLEQAVEIKPLKKKKSDEVI